MTDIIPLNPPAKDPGLIHGLIHGTGILLGPRALLLRGPSGSGKSRIAGALLRDATIAGQFARLVADDQVEVQAVNGRLLLGAPAQTTGLREHTGIGIFSELCEPRAIAGLVVDLIGDGQQSSRMPEEGAMVTRVEDIPLARLALKADAPGTVATILQAMALLSSQSYREDTLSTLRVESLLHPKPQIFNDRGRG